MKKTNIIAVILEIIIIVLVGFLVSKPFFKTGSQNILDDISISSPNEENTEVLESENSNNETNNPNKANNKNTNGNNIVFIELGLNPLINGEGAVVQNSNINIIEGGTYNLSGNLINGSIHIDTRAKVTLNFNNININSSKEVIVVDQAQEVIINIPAGSKNYLSNTKSNDSAIILTKSPLTFKGAGKLVINAYGKSIDASLGYTIEGGELCFFSQGKIEKPLDTTIQNVVIFNLDNIISTKEISLENLENKTIIQENVFQDTNNILISSNNLPSGSYYLYQNKEGKKEKIKINLTDIYELNPKINWFGKS